MEAIKAHAPRLFYILFAIAFMGAGVAKLMGVPVVHQSFALMGLPQWFGYFIGLCEAAGAIGLFIPKLRKLAAAGLAIIMVGAAYFHIAYAEPSPVPSIVLLVLCIMTMVWNWNRTARQ